MRRPGGQRGFTLLEVMIASTIMAVGIVSALQLFSGSMKLAGDADRQTKATVLARELIDEELWRDVLEATERSDQDGDFSYTVITHPVERELVGANEPEDKLHEIVGEIGLWLIQAEVRWQGPLGEKSLLLETARIGELPQ